jgi:8-oxo-dGTP pyrophosphatase MutT (NUDIX family)
MGISPYLRRLRDAVGHDLLLVPSVTVLARDDQGRILLVRQRDSGDWATVGGSIEVDETPEDCARREALEEAGVEVELGGIVAALAGPDFRVRYPNGDETAYVAVVYDAMVVDGEARPDHDETTEVGWFTPEEIATMELAPFALAQFVALGWR